jgi:hypothetical protein
MAEYQRPNEGELILYQTQEGAVRIEVLYESETFWLNQRKIAELFGVDLRTISYHLAEIYNSGELRREATLRKIWRVQQEGNREVRREIEFYNLDAIISVGYRVNSAQATQFRIWATRTLREFVIKGFVLDDQRLKLNKRFGKDYFDELLEYTKCSPAPAAFRPKSPGDWPRSGSPRSESSKTGDSRATLRKRPNASSRRRARLTPREAVIGRQPAVPTRCRGRDHRPVRRSTVTLPVSVKSCTSAMPAGAS